MLVGGDQVLTILPSLSLPASLGDSVVQGCTGRLQSSLPLAKAPGLARADQM